MVKWVVLEDTNNQPILSFMYEDLLHDPSGEQTQILQEKLSKRAYLHM